MLDLIEHVTEPERELARANRLLAPGGLLVINTPDAGSTYARLMGSGWHLIVPPEHLSYFNRTNLTTSLVKTGFEVVEFDTIGKRYTLPYIFRTLHGWQRARIWERLEKATDKTMSNFAIPINLRDNMFVIARKV